MKVEDIKVGGYIRLTEDVKIGISKLKKDTVFIVEDKDESSFTIKTI